MIASRSAIDEIFIVKIKAYLPKKDPGHVYTGAQIQKGYVEFLKSNDAFAVALKKRFPSEYSNFCLILENEISSGILLLLVILDLRERKLAKTIRKIYGRLSTLDHTLFKLLRSVYSIEKLGEFISKIPAILSSEELKAIQKVIDAYIEVDDTEDDEDTESDEDSKE